MQHQTANNFLGHSGSSAALLLGYAMQGQFIPDQQYSLPIKGSAALLSSL
jgi:hypothetical protein